ncbi:helix-turn-helix transcriptional regulator [Actinomadura napierensis]|uniref:HTH cro/C1-type domain-containing protein n=1 Tax=Actinomadura napierensis TaxID=267854 RepID=A0ABP5KQ42_9ACTN
MSEKKRVGERLRAARKAHGLTVADLAERFREVASDRVRQRLPSLRDLERTIRGHEAGEHAVGPRYRLLYAAALNTPEESLFGGDAGPREASGDGERLAFAVRNPARLDGTVIDGLAATLANQRRVEDVIGSQAVLGAAQAHLALVMRLLREAPDAHAARLLALASEASQFNGWLSTAVDAHAAAAPLYDQALRLGLQAGDKDLAATALSMRGHLAWASGEYRDMASLSETAAGLATAPGTRAVATQQRGRALALLRDRQGALQAIGRAEDVLAGQGGAADPDGLYFYGAAMLTMQRGLIFGYLEEHTTAADLLTDGIQAMPESIRGSEWVAWYRVKAAAARALAGDPEHAVAELRAAVEVLAATGGTKTPRDIAHVHRILKTRYPKHPSVTDLTGILC